MNADEIFVTALDIADPAQRDAWLERACAGDGELRREVDSLLAAHERIGDFLRKRPTLLARAAPVAASRESAGDLEGSSDPDAMLAALSRDAATILPAEKAGERIGRYKLLERIGEGGMGVVWMAEQEEPVRRRVALKIIRLGMDTREVVARFEAERQALALMDHPNIAKVFDGGATGAEGAESQVSNLKSQIPQGRPYFVMELVRGLPITKYCDEVKMSTRQRLELFAQVCRAVQHAHQKGIIHRDLKPSNILVTEQDGRPVPKVIDFGIAKATEGRLTDKTLFTAFQQLMGTPAYMSPEQAGLGSLDIDTRSDTYSLGVVLYQLLTGHTPFDTRELLKEGYEAVLRTIREVDPPKPSKVVERESKLRVERAKAGGGATGSTLNSQLDPLSTDLDWIVMKCLEKDRNRRYETPNGLALDIERYLHDEPVTARPPSALYRWQKFARKHRTGVAVAAGFVLLLTAAAVVSTVLALWANREREQAVRARKDESAQRARAETNEKTAQAEATKSREVVRFLEEMLQRVAPARALGRDTTMMREIVDTTAASIGKGLKGQPEVEAEIRVILGGIYHDLGLYDKMEKMGREALRLYQSSLGEKHPKVGVAMALLGDALGHHGDNPQAEPLLRQAIGILRETDTHEDLVHVLQTLAVRLRARGERTEAEALAREALAGARKLDGPKSAGLLASALGLLGDMLGKRGLLAEAAALSREALEVLHKELGADHPKVLSQTEQLALDLTEWSWLVNSRRAKRAIRRNADTTTPQRPSSSLEASAEAPLVEQKVLIDCAYEAERLLRECLVIHAKTPRQSECRLANAQSALGGGIVLIAIVDTSLGTEARRAKLSEAETLLLGAYPALRLGGQCGQPYQQYQEDILIRLVRLYRTWETFAPNPYRATKLAEWRQTLEEFDKVAAAQKAR